MANSTASISFEYRFKLKLIVTDYAGDADAIMAPMVTWLKAHQFGWNGLQLGHLSPPPRYKSELITVSKIALNQHHRLREE